MMKVSECTCGELAAVRELMGRDWEPKQFKLMEHDCNYVKERGNMLRRAEHEAGEWPTVVAARETYEKMLRLKVESLLSMMLLKWKEKKGLTEPSDEVKRLFEKKATDAALDDAGIRERKKAWMEAWNDATLFVFGKMVKKRGWAA